MEANNNESLVYTINEVSKLLKISLSSAYELVRTDNFPKIRIGEKRILIPRKELQSWLSENCNYIR